MIIIGKTIDGKDLVDVYMCDNCGYRTKYKDSASSHECLEWEKLKEGMKQK